jgi:alkanesulfonate monooxygenase SsuD/methylene tetrahydromethanopterin reductase-like flavin-dependent oxidoreductase (luciferase family)
MSASLDIISGGRLELGIGAGWQRDEHEAYGYSFPSLRIRMEKMKQGIEIIKKMWTTERPFFRGEDYEIKGPVCLPKPLQKPHPPIIIGGVEERYTLKAVASYANKWNFMGDINEYNKKLKVLEKHCEHLGRNISDIEKTIYAPMDVFGSEEKYLREMKDTYRRDYNGRIVTPDIPFGEWLDQYESIAIIGTPEQCIEQVNKCLKLGITEFMFRSSSRVPDLEKRRYSLNLFCEEVIPQIGY